MKNHPSFWSASVLLVDLLFVLLDACALTEPLDLVIDLTVGFDSWFEPSSPTDKAIEPVQPPPFTLPTGIPAGHMVVGYRDQIISADDVEF